MPIAYRGRFACGHAVIVPFLRPERRTGAFTFWSLIVYCEVIQFTAATLSIAEVAVLTEHPVADSSCFKYLSSASATLGFIVIIGKTPVVFYMTPPSGVRRLDGDWFIGGSRPWQSYGWQLARLSRLEI